MQVHLGKRLQALRAGIASRAFQCAIKARCPLVMWTCLTGFDIERVILNSHTLTFTTPKASEITKQNQILNRR